MHKRRAVNMIIRTLSATVQLFAWTYSLVASKTTYGVSSARTSHPAHPRTLPKAVVASMIRLRHDYDITILLRLCYECRTSVVRHSCDKMAVNINFTDIRRFPKPGVSDSQRKSTVRPSVAIRAISRICIALATKTRRWRRVWLVDIPQYSFIMIMLN